MAMYVRYILVNTNILLYVLPIVYASFKFREVLAVFISGLFQPRFCFRKRLPVFLENFGVKSFSTFFDRGWETVRSQPGRRIMVDAT
jgi:hypothetical protein